MKHTRPLLTVATLAGLALCSTLTFAQDPGGQNPNGQRGGFQGPGGQRGGPGGFGGQMPMAMGTITAGDQSGRLTIQSQFGNGTQTVLVTTATKLVTQSVVSVSDLKVNDQVQIQGVPTGISASSITAGQMPDFMPGGGQNRGGGGNPGGPGGARASAGGQAATATGFASATGKVVSLSPLTISLGTDITMTVKLAADAKITRITTTTFSKLKVGDRVMASGQAGADGVFTATGLAINMQMGGPGGQGGFGRGQGGPGGGPGGQRGPGGGPGGNGGPGGPPPDGAGGPPPDGDPNGT